MHRLRFGTLGLVSLAGLLALMACGGTSDSPLSDSSDGASGEVPTTGDAAVTRADALTGTASEAVTWSVQEVGAGTITAAGLYTAPATAGTYHVVVQSQADATKTATATVTVTAPAGGSAVDVRAYGAVGDGVTDDTAAFQAAANTKKPLFVSAPSVRYRITTTVRIYNSVQGDGSMPEIFMDTPSGNWDGSIFNVLDYAGTGLTISGLHLNGGWDGTASGEYSAGVHLGGAQNVTIENNTIENLRGDGVYVGNYLGTTGPSKNITIRKNTITNPRRCTVALLDADGVSITNNTLNKANSYVANIDIEPSLRTNTDWSVWNVLIDSNVFTTPNDNGVSLYFGTGWNVPTGGVGGNITISNNTGKNLAGVNITPSSGIWQNVTQTNNVWK